MPCSSLNMYPLAILSELDTDEFYFGQLIVLAAGLSLVVAGRALLLLVLGY